MPSNAMVSFWKCIKSMFCRWVARANPMQYLINRFHAAVRLFSNRTHMQSKSVKNKKVAHEAQLSVSLMFLPH